MSNNKIISSKILGVEINQLNQINDDRGAVLHMLRIDSPGYAGFGEVYFSEIQPGAVKAWKYHKEQIQNFSVPIGSIRLVIFDDRNNSKTKGNLEILDLGRPDSYYRVTIQPKLWYGFLCTSNSVALLANCVNIPHSRFESITKDINDSDIPYKWK